jgi:ribonuclease-3
MEQLWQKIASFTFLRNENRNTSGSKSAGIEDTSSFALSPAALYLESLTGIACGDRVIYRTALTHRSVLHDQNLPSQSTESNQRLEFLGDAVLDLLISAYLYKRFPASDEGILSSNRSKIVNRKSLAGFAQSINLGDHLIIGDSADRNRIRTSESALADAFESLIGAIYLDQGIAAAERFVMKHVIDHVNFNRIVEEEHNYKSRLIEFTQSRQLQSPVYTVTAEEGAEHEKTFIIEVSCMGIVLGKGSAQRKKDAEQTAAREAMRYLEVNHPFDQAKEA